tara:strand:+ start:630 stop:836 length:207 start_codon:yes stop_codon:yes gene_type:complete
MEFTLRFGQLNRYRITFTLTFDNKIMKARFDGKCKSCGDDIRKGKEIAKNADEVWVHKHCVEELVDLP